ncbi:uncharacterized protein JN550_000071 [Neoarthrinium moseri]|uniref:uncharacterized protein n=1 Tax=Neoarthrinium moseri TaxID=1658444 RepID=UPI001FDC33AB|nr:uncharacterized protein JN550_000071 [Neoarthrinium moseri]KAI1877889.1 hypothetical protein JN550_000071 [Neoarthrinium moseri]
MEASQQGAEGETATQGSKPVVCFLGPVTSYTHQAAMQTFSPDRYELLPVVTIKGMCLLLHAAGRAHDWGRRTTDVFETTQSGRAAYGVVPFENSTNGSVVFTLDHFADREGRYGDLSVCGEAYLDVHHCLLGRLPNAAAADGAGPESSSLPAGPKGQPLASLAHVQRIYSHPQAWGQCTRFMGAHLRGIETIDVSSTSRAAELAATDASGTSAAISSALAGEANGLGFLARDIEDRDDNTTRFFVLRKLGADADAAGDDAGDAWWRRPAGRKTKSLASFTVPHTAPGALAGVLECFRQGGLNLTSINSRPSLIEPFQYVFFVEFEGHRLEDPNGRVRDVLEGVGRVAQSWRWLGSWVNMRV